MTSILRSAPGELLGVDYFVAAILPTGIRRFPVSRCPIRPLSAAQMTVQPEGGKRHGDIARAPRAGAAERYVARRSRVDRIGRFCASFTSTKACCKPGRTNSTSKPF